jgi:hypothetical protein
MAVVIQSAVMGGDLFTVVKLDGGLSLTDVAQR